MKKFTELLLKLFMVVGFAVFFFVPYSQAQEKVSSSAGNDNAKQVLSNFLTDTVNVLYGTKPLRNVTGAISTVSGKEMENVSGHNRMNALSGRVAGLFVTQSEGLPGYEAPALDVRGNHTFGNYKNPVVLVDGHYTDYNALDPYDIESVTVLKDAAAAVMYGLRSTNGVILITTKKGKSGKIHVSFNSETSFSQPTRLPKFLDAAQYAQLYDEAQLNDNPAATPKYDAAAIEAFKNGSDPYKYPNVNWTKTLLKDYEVQTRNSIGISGGGKTSKYYVSASYLSDNGLFNTDKSINTYSTNNSLRVTGVHGNVELDLQKNLTFSADMRLSRDVRNAPGGYSGDYDTSLFTYLYSTPFAAHPIRNANGSIAGTADYQNNPFGLLNYKGYSIWDHTTLSFHPSLVYDLGSVVKGLKLKANFGYTNLNEYYTNRVKNFATYQLNADGVTYTKRGLDTAIGNTGGQSSIYRYFEQAASATYDAVFGKHSINAFLMYQREQIEAAMVSNLAQNYQGPKGNFSYGYDNRYLVDFTFAYQGSEQYPASKRYGFFPAVSAGWVLSNEKFMKDLKFVNFLKIRGSYGLTGNTSAGAYPGAGTYFAYLGSFSTGTGYYYGVSPASLTGYTQNRVVNPVDWEKCKKGNVGIDFALLNNRLSGSFDYFHERNEDINISGAITGMYGATAYNPVGIFQNKGFEVALGWNDKIGKNFEYFVKGNFSIAQNKVVYSNEQFRNHPWMYTTGHPSGCRYGYVFDRYFVESDFDANNKPVADIADQSLLGTTQPGDLKYKDLSNDGVIDANDQTVIGDPKIPEINYGINLGFKTCGFDFNALIMGTGNSTTYNSGYTYWDFNGKIGNVLEHHLGRWVPGSGQNATYPRLSIAGTNNYVSSSYWVQDNSFVRFKYVELGYTLPSKVSKKIGASKVRFFVNGNNLFVWSNVKDKDPELQENGLAYPIPRTYSVGLNLNF